MSRSGLMIFGLRNTGARLRRRLSELFALPNPEHAAFREQTLRYARSEGLFVRRSAWARPDWLGAVAANVFLRAGIDEHLRCTTDIRSVTIRATFACLGLCERAGVTLHPDMVAAVVENFGAPTPMPRPFRTLVRQAFAIVEQQRLLGSLDEQPEELMVARYVLRQEPLVLQSLAAQLHKQVHLGRQTLRPAAARRSVSP